MTPSFDDPLDPSIVGAPGWTEERRRDILPRPGGAMGSFEFRILDSPIGDLLLAVGPRGLRRLVIRPGPDAIRTVERRWGMTAKRSDGLGHIVGPLDAYFAGRGRRFSLPLDLSDGTRFDRLVWRALRRIPWGGTTSYGEIARAIGHPGASRAVGNAVGRNPIPIILPCHRVIRHNGRLGGFSGGLSLKRWLLRHEGLSIHGSVVRAAGDAAVHPLPSRSIR